MSGICRNMGVWEKLWFYELDRESNMRLLKTHSHTSNGLANGARKTRRKTVEGSEDPTTRKTTHKKPAAYRRCGGGGQKRLYGKQTTDKGTMARHTLVETKENTDVNTREKSSRKPPADRWQMVRGEVRKRKYTRSGR